MPLLELNDIVRTYRIHGGLLGMDSKTLTAVNHVSLQLDPGETLGLVGESGCGKSTLARCAAGLETPNQGQILFRGKPLSNPNTPEFRRNVQIVFQDPYSSLNPRMQIGSIVREPLDIHGMGSRAERKKRAAELLEMVGLTAEHVSRYPHEFSGGQRQRVAIARALALQPELLILDEPVSALDVSVQAQVLTLLMDLQEHFGLAYLFISHDLSVVGNLCNRVAVMYLGRIMEDAPAEEMFAEPKHPYTQALVSAVPVPDPDVTHAPVKLEGDPPNPADPPEGCPFHPRCPAAFDRCVRERPTLDTISPTRSTACWLYADQ